MADHKLIVSATDTGGATVQKTITGINPDAGNTPLATFGQMLNGLTDNVYGRTDRVIKIHCDTEGGSGKATPTLTLAKTSETLANVRAGNSANASKNCGYCVEITSDSDSLVYANIEDNVWCKWYAGVTTQGGKLQLSIVAHNTLIDSTEPVVITVFTKETDNYKAAEATFTITA